MRKICTNLWVAITFILLVSSCNDNNEPANESNSMPTINMVYVECGTFLMGATIKPGEANYDSEAHESEKYNQDEPTHPITLPSFYIGKYEITQQQWEYVMNYSGYLPDGSRMDCVGNGDPWLGDNPIFRYGIGDNYPAYYVSYDDIVTYFIPRLNKITGKNYRLPTEAEWEYAAKGGQKDEYTRTQGIAGIYYRYAGSNNPADVVWYNENSGGKLTR